MGIGQALTEGARYDGEGHQRTAGLLDYKLQTCADAPPITTHFVQIATPDAGPRGAKGLAEAPNVPTAAAISTALARLIGGPLRQLPMSAERVWERVVDLSVDADRSRAGS
jgi:carbon-monoxide dehydrogenase large subunit